MNEDKIQDFAFTLNQLPGITDVVSQELVQLYQKVIESNEVEAIVKVPSKKCLKFLYEKLRQQPEIVTTLVQSLLCLWNRYFAKTDAKLQSMYRNIIEDCIREIKDGTEESKDTLLCILSQIQMSEKDLEILITNLIPELINLMNNDKVKKKELYLNLIPQRRQQILNKLLDEEVNMFTKSFKFSWKCDSLFYSCVFMKSNWLQDFVEDYHNNKHLLESLSVKSSSKILSLMLFRLTNIKIEFNEDYMNTIEEITNRLKKCSEVDEDIINYCIEISRQMLIIKFCFSHSKGKYNWYELVEEYSFLNILSKTCDIHGLSPTEVKKQFKQNQEILSVLKKICQGDSSSSDTDDLEIGKKDSNWECKLYDSYYILKLGIDIVMLEPKQNSYETIVHALKDIKELFFMIKSIQSKVELLENIFSLLFLRYENIQNIDVRAKGSGFICHPLVARDLLCVLNESIMDTQSKSYQTLKYKNHLDISNYQDRLVKLKQYVTSASWRLHLLTNEEFATSINVFQPIDLCVDCAYNLKYFPGDESTDYSTDDEPSTPLRKKPVKRRKSEVTKSSEGSGSTNTNTEGSSTGKSSKRSRKSVQLPPEVPKDFIGLMLSTPESLLAQCVVQGDFKKTKEVIQMFNLHGTHLAVDIKYTEHYQNLKSKLKSISEQYNETPSSGAASTLETIRQVAAAGYGSIKFVNKLEVFLNTHTLSKNIETIDAIETYKSSYPYIYSYNHDRQKCVTMVDLLLSLGANHQTSVNLTNLATKYCSELSPEYVISGDIGYICYVKTLIDLLFETKSAGEDVGFIDIVTGNYPLNLKKYKFDLQFNKCLADTLPFITDKDSDSNKIEEVHIAFKKLINNFKSNPPRNIAHQKRKKSDAPSYKGTIETVIEEDRSKINYLRRLYSYLNNVVALLGKEYYYDIIENSHFLNIVKMSLNDIIGALVFDRGVLPSNLENIASVMNINLVHILILNCCKDIKCKTDTSDEELLKLLIDLIHKKDLAMTESQISEIEECRKYIPNILISSFIDKHNWLISVLVKSIHGLNDDFSNDLRVKELENSTNLTRIQQLKILYDNNATVASLEYGVAQDLLYKYMRRLILNNNYDSCLLVLNAIPALQYKHSKYLSKLKNEILFILSSIKWRHFQFIDNADYQLDCVLKNMKCWDKVSVTNALQCMIERYDFHKFDSDTQKDLKTMLKKVNVYGQILEFTEYHNWYEIQTISDTVPEVIFNCLIVNKKLQLCLDWIEIHPLSDNIKLDVKEEAIIAALETGFNQNSDILIKFIRVLPKTLAVKVCDSLLVKINNIEDLNVVVDFLLECNSKTNKYNNYEVSAKILLDFNIAEREACLELINNPLIILEQFLMNSKFDKLHKIIKVTQKILTRPITNDYSKESNNLITIKKVDELVRSYASKSLMFNVGNTVPLACVSPAKSDILQSIDSNSFLLSEEEFVMPVDVPTKAEWVSNDEVTECMCCKNSTFTMFNRRHHCRRCGRVVCGTCSTKRLKLPLYDNLNVRVCINCYDHTHSTDVVANDLSFCNSSRCSSVTEMAFEWRLSSDASHNHTVRGEFSFDNAPNVSLCLSILNLHSANSECPEFLLVQCENLVKILKPKISGNLNPEIDHSLLIRMVRSLALAAKVKYSQLIQTQLNVEELSSSEKSNNFEKVPTVGAASRSSLGLSKCDTILFHADLMNVLVEHGCAGLIPDFNLSGHGLRRLRDSLVRSERWNVALELSTKAGLGRGGVLAAWGKSCLRAGAFTTARDKFKYCLRSTSDQKSESRTNTPQGTPVSTPPKFGSYNESINLSVNDSTYSSVNGSSNLSSELMDPYVQNGPTNLSPVASESNAPIGRPSKNPSLLNEIVNILESISYEINPDVLKDFEKIKVSTSMLANSKPSKSSMRDGQFNEPALNVLHTLASLKNISAGNYEPNYKMDAARTLKKQKSVTKPPPPELNLNQLNNRPLEPLFFDECMYYLTTYGSHESIIAFYLRHGNLKQVLDYFSANNVDSEVFTEVIYMACLKRGHIDMLHDEMFGMDNSLAMWKDQLKHVCLYLLQSKLLNTLYQLQIFMHDFVRAGMTCVRFYNNKCKSYTDLLNNVEYLNNAERHFHQELEQVHWKNIAVPAQKREDKVSLGSIDGTLIKTMDSKELNRHIHTICRQREVTKFLAACETEEKDTLSILAQIFRKPSLSSPAGLFTNGKILTLFGTQNDRLQLAVLTIVCGQSVEDGFGLSYRIIQDYQLDAALVYTLACRYLVAKAFYDQIEKLCQCIMTSGIRKQTAISICDKVISLAIRKMVDYLDKSDEAIDNTVVENLIKIVQDIAVKITCYIQSRQLKSAYLLAAKHDRMIDVRRIMREAERLEQHHIKNICSKRLAQQ